MIACASRGSTTRSRAPERTTRRTPRGTGPAEGMPTSIPRSDRPGYMLSTARAGGSRADPDDRVPEHLARRLGDGLLVARVDHRVARARQVRDPRRVEARLRRAPAVEEE